MATINPLPVFLRIGDQPERQIGVVTATSEDAFFTGTADVLRAAAGALDEDQDLREQHTPRDRQVREPRRTR